MGKLPTPFPLNIVRPKVDSAERILQLQGVDPSLYTTAAEFNAVLSALDYLNSLANPVQNYNHIISGDVVRKEKDSLIYKTINVLYEWNGQIYFSNADETTLSAPDLTNDRFDLPYLDNEGLKSITGEASANPQQPSYDPATQIPVFFVLVKANNTTPGGVTVVKVYEENLQQAGGEYDTLKTTHGVGFDFENPSNPIYDTKDIKTLDIFGGDKILLTGGDRNTVDINHLKLSFRALSYWSYDRIIIRLKKDGATVISETINATSLDTLNHEIVQDVFLFTKIAVEAVFNQIEFELIANGIKSETPITCYAKFQVDDIYFEMGDDSTPGTNTKIGIANLAPELKATHAQGTATEVNVSMGVHFECTKQTADKTMTFINPVENKMIKMTVNLDSNALTLTGIDVTELDLDGGDTWETFIIEWTKVGGVLKAKALNHAVWA